MREGLLELVPRYRNWGVPRSEAGLLNVGGEVQSRIGGHVARRRGGLVRRSADGGLHGRAEGGLLWPVCVLGGQGRGEIVWHFGVTVRVGYCVVLAAVTAR